MPVKGFFTGSGLLLALVGGGLALNASLFNGAYILGLLAAPRLIYAALLRVIHS